jgi:hypothetical protein
MSKTKEAPILEKDWEIKDRTYLVTGKYKPLTFRIPSRHSAKKPLLWYDEKTGRQRELRYATNMNSPFKDEQEGEATMGTILFKDGALVVPKQYQALQKLLSLYHPMKGSRYKEFDSKVQAKDELDIMELQIDALNAARAMEVEHLEAIMRVEVGSKVSTMSSKELKRDALIFARQNPVLFLELSKDENVQLRNFAILATEAKIIKLSQDQRSFTWASNDKKLMSVPFDENPYSAMAAFFKTDEGVEVFKSIEKKLK